MHVDHAQRRIGGDWASSQPKAFSLTNNSVKPYTVQCTDVKTQATGHGMSHGHDANKQLPQNTTRTTSDMRQLAI